MAKPIFQPNFTRGLRFKRMRAMASARDALARIFMERGGKAMAGRLALWHRWEEVMGADIASLGVPLDCRDTTLTVAAFDSMAMQELKFQTDIILDLANSFIGMAAFAKVRLTLLDDRTPLNAGPSPKHVPVPVKPQPLQPPPDFGHLQSSMDPDSIVGRCYLAVCEAYRQK